MQTDSSGEWNQHFPTYSFKEKEIALEEYKNAAASVASEEKVFLSAANVSLATSAALGSLLIGYLDRLTAALAPIVEKEYALPLILLVTYFATTVLLRYFADRQKAIAFASRKVIVLRRMLGMSYGPVRLVLPNWRIEGANEPIAIRMFPGWNTYVCYPFFAIAGASTVVFFVLIVMMMKGLGLHDQEGEYNPAALLTLLVFAYFSRLAWVFRKSLVDTHESMLLVVTKGIAKLLSLKLVDNFEYVIYRAVLAKHEFIRLKIDLNGTKKILVFVEDETFYSHHGLSARGTYRALRSVFGGPRSGGSTITQQLARTLFVVDQRKVWRRKCVEILLALWLDKAIGKEDQLALYLASVRFEHGTQGLTAGMKHFFGSVKKDPSSAQSFFLIERVANIRSGLLVKRVAQVILRAKKASVLGQTDVEEVLDLYSKAVGSRTINGTAEDLAELTRIVSG